MCWSLKFAFNRLFWIYSKAPERQFFYFIAYSYWYNGKLSPKQEIHRNFPAFNWEHFVIPIWVMGIYSVYIYTVIFLYMYMYLYILYIYIYVCFIHFVVWWVYVVTTCFFSTFCLWHSNSLWIWETLYRGLIILALCPSLRSPSVA